MRRRLKILLVILAVSVLCVYCVVNAAPDIPMKDFTEQSEYEITKLIDSDTVEFLKKGWSFHSDWYPYCAKNQKIRNTIDMTHEIC